MPKIFSFNFDWITRIYSLHFKLIRSLDSRWLIDWLIDWLVIETTRQVETMYTNQRTNYSVLHFSAICSTVPIRFIVVIIKTLYCVSSYASAVLAVVILSVRQSVCHTFALSQNQIIHCGYFDIRRKVITLVFWYQQWLVCDVPFRQKFALKVTHPPSKQADFDRFPLLTSQP